MLKSQKIGKFEYFVVFSFFRVKLILDKFRYFLGKVKILDIQDKKVVQ